MSYGHEDSIRCANAKKSFMCGSGEIQLVVEVTARKANAQAEAVALTTTQVLAVVRSANFGDVSVARRVL